MDIYKKREHKRSHYVAYKPDKCNPFKLKPAENFVKRRKSAFLVVLAINHKQQPEMRYLPYKEINGYGNNCRACYISACSCPSRNGRKRSNQCARNDRERAFHF